MGFPKIHPRPVGPGEGAQKFTEFLDAGAVEADSPRRIPSQWRRWGQVPARGSRRAQHFMQGGEEREIVTVNNGIDDAQGDPPSGKQVERSDDPVERAGRPLPVVVFPSPVEAGEEQKPRNVTQVGPHRGNKIPIGHQAE